MIWNEPIVLIRDCTAIMIPSGQMIVLPGGTPVTITQALGGTFTVMTERGLMARVSEDDADALGRESPPPKPQPDPTDRAAVEQRVWEELATCYDPEIPINVVDLGLVYECQLTDLPEGGFHVKIVMTLTSPGCGMGNVLATDVRRKLLMIRGVYAVDVDVVFDPPWDRSRISEAAQLQMGIY